MSIIETIEYFPLFDAEPGDEPAGVSAAIGSGVAAVGVPDALGGAGAVVLYFYSTAKNAWGYVGVLSGSKIAGSEQVRALGSSCVAFGDTVIVGAPGDASTPGRVFVLSPPYGAWSYTAIPVVAELSPRDPVKGDQFGASVAHCSDGTTDYVAVGAPGAAAPRGVSGNGQVYIFRGLEASNAPWSTSPIANPNQAGTETDLFGASVAINPSGDGSGEWDGTLTLAVAAPGADNGEGAVYVGRTTQPGAWTSPFRFAETLVPMFPEAEDEFHTTGFGTSIALTGGVTLAVGSPDDPNFDELIEGTGAVWIFNFVDGAFVPGATTSRLYGSAEGMRFGASVAFAETAPSDAGQASSVLPQAEYLLVGAPGPVEGELPRAYRYVNDTSGGTSFTEDAQFVSSGRQQGDQLGGSVATSAYQYGSWYLVAARGDRKADEEGGGYLYADGDPAPAWMDTPVLVTTPPLRWGGLPPDWWKKFTPKIEKYLT